MSILLNEPLPASSQSTTDAVRVTLSKADVALIIDALLQAEMTLPLIDRRYRAMKAIEALRVNQLQLADRLEDLMSSPAREDDRAGASLCSASAERQP